MTKFSDFRLETLANLLVQYTGDFARLVSRGVYTVEEYTQYRQVLNAIKEAIDAKTNHPTEYFIPGETQGSKQVA